MPKQAIGQRILDHYTFLRKIAKSKSEDRRLSLIRNAKRDELLCLVEVAANVISSKFLLSKKQKLKLFPHAEYIRQLARVRYEIGARKVVQKGNGIVLSSLLIPIIAEAASLLLSKRDG